MFAHLILLQLDLSGPALAYIDPNTVHSVFSGLGPMEQWRQNQKDSKTFLDY